MPELPEVEVTMRGIRPALMGSKIVSVWHDDKKLREEFDDAALKSLEGQDVAEVKRRAKYILVKTSGGTLIIHLGMTGHLSVLQQPEDRKKHDHFELKLANGTLIRYNDSRRFGLIACVKKGEDPYASKYLKDLGPEPLEDGFTPEYLFERLSKIHKSIKQALMDAAVVVGVGNIYASEVLFLSRISPLRKACEVTRKECGLLCANIKKTLASSIEKGGTTIINFQGADGKLGYFVQNLKVYGHAGEKCGACGHEILQITQGQRSTFYCPHCQQ